MSKPLCLLQVGDPVCFEFEGRIVKQGAVGVVEKIDQDAEGSVWVHADFDGIKFSAIQNWGDEIVPMTLDVLTLRRFWEISGGTIAKASGEK